MRPRCSKGIPGPNRTNCPVGPLDGAHDWRGEHVRHSPHGRPGSLRTQIVDDATLLDDFRDCRCRVARSGSSGPV